ncbi:MAG: histidinol-phosphate transaminase [Patescibacteria group bacterium]
MATLNLDLNESGSLKKPRSYARTNDYEAARQVIANYTGLDPKGIAVTNGSYHALDLIFGSFLKAGAEAIIPVPTFPFYQKLEWSEHLELKKIRCVSEADYDQVLEAISPETKALYLANPNNPLGYLLPLSLLTKILTQAQANKTWVVVDEAYYEFSGLTLAPLLNQFENLIIVRTFSKAFGLPGTRMGYILAQPAVISKLEELKGPSYIISHYGLDLVTKLKPRDFAKVRKNTMEIKDTREKLVASLKQAGLTVYPSAANFLTVKVTDSDRLVKALAERGILINNLNTYPDGAPELRNHLRITVPPKSQLVKVTSALLALM